MVGEDDEATVLAAAPAGDDVIDWVAEGHSALVRTLSDAPANLECWTFLPAPSPLAFWSRRQAHETAIHRVDTQIAAGLPPAGFTDVFAADGLDELVAGFFGRRRPESVAGDGSWTLALRPTDWAGQEGGWVVRMRGTRAAEAEPGAEVDVAVWGPVSDLYRFAWNRRGTEGLAIEGSGELLAGWVESARVTWS